MDVIQEDFMKKTKSEKIWWKKSEGFTFVETLAVLAIGAVLAAGSVVSASKFISMAKKTAARNQINQLCSAMQCYFLDCGRFPTTEQGINALWEKPSFYPVPDSWNGPYVDRRPGKDPWGNDYKYLSAESGSMPNNVPSSLPFVVISYGADGVEGGEGDAYDVSSWE